MPVPPTKIRLRAVWVKPAEAKGRRRGSGTGDSWNMPIRLAQATPMGSGTVLLPPTSATERVSTGEFGWTHAPAPLLATR